MKLLFEKKPSLKGQFHCIRSILYYVQQFNYVYWCSYDFTSYIMPHCTNHSAEMTLVFHTSLVTCMVLITKGAFLTYIPV